MKFNDVYDEFFNNSNYQVLRNYIIETVNSNDDTLKQLKKSHMFCEENNLERITVVSSEDKKRNRVFISPKYKSMLNITEISFKNEKLDELNRLVLVKEFCIDNVFYTIKLMVGSKNNTKGYFALEFKSMDDTFFYNEKKIELIKNIEIDGLSVYSLKYKEDLNKNRKKHLYTEEIKVLFKQLEEINNNSFFDNIIEYIAFDKNNDFSKEQKELFHLIYDKNIDIACFEKFKLNIKTKNPVSVSQNNKQNS